MIGKGSTGEIFIVNDKIKKHIDYNSLDSSIAEITILKMLSHPHVVVLFNWEFHDAGANLYMERGDCDMQTYIERSRRPPNSIINKWCGQVAAAIAYMHSRGIIHGDIKLANIILFGNDVKICDFGLSTIVTEMPVPHVMVCPLHRPPECWFYEQTGINIGINYSIDTWAFGVLIILFDTWNRTIVDARVRAHCSFKLSDYSCIGSELRENDARPLLSTEIASAHADEIAACLARNWRLRPQMRDIAAAFGIACDAPAMPRKFADIVNFYKDSPVKDFVVAAVTNTFNAEIPCDIDKQLRDWVPFN